MFSLRTHDPKVARQLSRRLAVLFDEIAQIMEQSTRHPTKEQQQAIIQTFRDLVQERIDLHRAITWTPTEEQLRELLEQGPDSQEALQAVVDAEQAYLDSNPEAKAALEERYAAHAATVGFANLEVLKAKWSDAPQRNDTALVFPLMKEVLERNSVALSPNSNALAQLARQAPQGGVEVLESAISKHKPSDQPICKVHLPRHFDEQATPAFMDPGSARQALPFIMVAARRRSRYRALVESAHPASYGAAPGGIVPAHAVRHS